jgi:hypothetical protein
LHALGVFELVLAEAQYLMVIQSDGQNADEQERAQNEPEDANASGKKRIEVEWAHGGLTHPFYGDARECE